MNAELRLLRRWLQRSQPEGGSLLRALASGLVASLVNLALVVGAVGLLVESATRPGLRTVLGALIVIELFAFLRSPLRFAERLSAHRLGFAAVTRWRRWLVLVIGHFDFTRWRSYAAGDLLERALRDSDELQDLWLRGVIPLVTSGVVMAVSDLFIGLMAPHGRWWSYAGDLVAVQLLGVAALATNLGPLVRRDRVLRRARAAFRAQVVEVAAATPELALLLATDFVAARVRGAAARLNVAERRLHRRRQLSAALPPAMTVLAVGALVVRPVSASLWLVVAAMLALSTFDLLATVRDALDTAVHVSAAAERLEELDVTSRTRDSHWPSDTTLRLDRVTLEEDGAVLVADASLVVLPGKKVAITGPSGVGKSTLLRAVAALDDVATGTITIGGVNVGAIRDHELRRSLGYVASEPGLTRGYALDVVTLGREGPRDAVEDLASLGVTGTSSTKWDELSRGERARIGVARAMFTGPSLYLLDEPTSGLGVDETAAVLGALASTGATVLIATHDPLVMAWCDEVYELRDAALHDLRR